MDLIKAMQTEYSRCKRLLYFGVLPISMGLFLAALVGCLPLPDGPTKFLAIVVLLGQVVAFFLRRLADDHQGRAENIRRMAMMQDGLAIDPSPYELARLQEIIGDCNHKEPPFVGKYYGSEEPHGPRRLLHITAECSFFTGGNARRMATILHVLSYAGLVVAGMGLFIAIQFSDSVTAVQIIAKTALLIIAGCSFGNLQAMAGSFASLSQRADEVLRGCEDTLKHTETHKAAYTAALSLFSAYNCAVVKAPPIPGWIYRRSQDRMNNAWSAHLRARTQPAPAAPSQATTPTSEQS